MPRSKQKWLIILFTLFFTLTLTSSVSAVQLKSGDTVTIPEGSIKGPLFISGNNLTVNGDVEGDIFAIGQSITINGRVKGDVIAAGNTIKVNGTISGDIRAAGNTIEVEGLVSDSLTLAGNNITFQQTAQTARDVVVFGNNATLLGTVQGQVIGSVSHMHLNGPVNGDVELWQVQNLTIGPSADLNGNTNYRSENLADIDANAQVGPINRLAPLPRPEKPESTVGTGWTGVSIFFILGTVLAGIVLWGVYYLIFPSRLPRSGQTAQEEFLPTLGKGFLTLLVVPPVVLLLFITMIGIPLALLVLIAYIIILCLANILVGDYISRYALNRFGWQGNWAFFGAFAVSLLLLIAIKSIPVLGFFIALVVAATAMGMVISWITKYRKGETAIANE